MRIPVPESTTGAAPEAAGTDRPDFRAATPADVPALLDLVESAYRGDASRSGWTTEADLLAGQRTDAEGVTAAVTHQNGVVLLAELDGELLACCQLEHRGTRAYFGMFSVRPGRQGGGLGRAVLARAERYAAEEWGVVEMEMTVIEQRTELIAWYERRGFRRTGDYSPFPYGNERFGIPLRPDLRFEKLIKEITVR
ncbi:GNAT family N-acetyltransferase [Kitasatospora sp. NPDC094019]|uniref:GNAT family N-acetyltransferase n=1 Tax=Kitasatospora sp. NPDC094019 TaxID=3364091 RepID=UPI003802A7CF